MPTEEADNYLMPTEADNYSIKVFAKEASFLVQLAWPVIISYLLSFCLNFTSVISLGHIGRNELAAIALASMLCNVTGFSVGMGLASAMDTLCSQAHTGSCDPHSLGKHLQRGIVVVFIVSIPISILWTFTEPLLVLLGQDTHISMLAGLFTRWMIPGLFPYLVADCLRRYLQAQAIMKPYLSFYCRPMYITMIAVPMNVFLQWLLVWYLAFHFRSPYSIGVIGAPISTSIINCLIPIMTIIYIRYYEGGDAYGGWEWREAFDVKQLVVFVKLGVPGVLMICSEWWAYEVVALAAGMIGGIELAAQSVLINTTGFFYMNSIGAAIASTYI
jgi:MATE family multidrug resistance protein